MALDISNPLQWPAHQPRTPRGRQTNLHGFSASLTVEEALRYLDEEVQKLHPLRSVVSTHIEHFNSPRLRKLEGTSPAVALSLRLGDARYHLACDRWLLPQHNVYAIVMSLRAIAQLEGWGVIDRAQLFEPFREQAPAHAVQPQAVSTIEPWRQALGLGLSATLADANAVYRARARSMGEHDPVALARLNEAIEQARQALPEGA